MLEIIVKRKSVRKFADRKVPDPVLVDVLDATLRAPSSFNLQPWQIIVVRDEVVKRNLYYVAMKQQQILSSDSVIVFVADPDAWRKPYEKILKRSVESQALDEEKAEYYRNQVDLFFRLGPFGIFGFLKRIGLPIVRLRTPVPTPLCSRHDVEEYVCKQTMIAATTFLIAAEGAGLATSPMEGFDEFRIKRLLKIPLSKKVPIIVAVGYPLDLPPTPQSVRFRLDESVSLDYYLPLREEKE